MSVRQHTIWTCGACAAAVDMGFGDVCTPPPGWRFLMLPKSPVFEPEKVLCTACIRRLFVDKVLKSTAT